MLVITDLTYRIGRRALLDHATAHGWTYLFDTIETRRVLWLDKDGTLVIERTGTPASEVTPSRSVYTRVR